MTLRFLLIPWQLATTMPCRTTGREDTVDLLCSRYSTCMTSLLHAFKCATHSSHTVWFFLAFLAAAAAAASRRFLRRNWIFFCVRDIRSRCLPPYVPVDGASFRSLGLFVVLRRPSLLHRIELVWLPTWCLIVREMRREFLVASDRERKNTQMLAKKLGHDGYLGRYVGNNDSP